MASQNLPCEMDPPKTNAAPENNGESPDAAPERVTFDLNDVDDDYKPPPRDAFHTNVKLCDEMLATVKASVPLKIRSSGISMGSGLFVAANIDAGHEIYHSKPLMTV